MMNKEIKMKIKKTENLYMRDKYQNVNVEKNYIIFRAIAFKDCPIYIDRNCKIIQYSYNEALKLFQNKTQREWKQI